jgi:hypothetical protein
LRFNLRFLLLFTVFVAIITAWWSVVGPMWHQQSRRQRMLRLEAAIGHSELSPAERQQVVQELNSLRAEELAKDLEEDLVERQHR